MVDDICLATLGPSRKINFSHVFYISRFYIWRAACFRVTRLRNYKFRKTAFRGKNRFCHQWAPRESSGQTDHTNLRHFSVRVFLVGFCFGIWHGRKVLQIQTNAFLSFIFGGRHAWQCPAKLKTCNIKNDCINIAEDCHNKTFVVLLGLSSSRLPCLGASKYQVCVRNST